MKIINSDFVFLLILIIFFTIGCNFSFAGVYNVHSVSYTYGCNGSDSRGDGCGAGEIVLKIDRGGAPMQGSYRCGKKDNTAPDISDFVSTIKPVNQWVNILDYNPLKDFKVTIRDNQSGVKKIVITVGNHQGEWIFSPSVTYKDIRYDDLCNKVIGTTYKCRQKLLTEGKNIIKVEAYDAALSSYDGKTWEPNSSSKETYVFVDNSRPSYGIGTAGDKAYAVMQVDSKILKSQIFSDNLWKNMSLSLIYLVKDKLGENGGLHSVIKYCSGKPQNSIWYLPSDVDPNTGKFTAYCDSNGYCNPDPSTSCKWKCKSGYIEVNGKCILEKKTFSCKTYFQNKGYDLSKVDGNTLYFGLNGYGSDTIDKKEGTFTAIYNNLTNKYQPTLEDCLLIPGNVSFTITQVDNGNEVSVTTWVAGIVKLIGKLVKVIPSIDEESCGKLSQLTDFVGQGGNAKGGGGGDMVVPKYWVDNNINGGGIVNRKDDNYNSFVDDEEEGHWFYLKNDGTFTTNIEDVCGSIQCVPNADWLDKDKNNCRCNSDYYPIEENNKNRYNKCVKLSTDKCVSDSDGDGFYDTVKYLSSNQIVKMMYTQYNETHEIPVCGDACSFGYKAVDTNGDGWKDSCKRICPVGSEYSGGNCLVKIPYYGDDIDNYGSCISGGSQMTKWVLEAYHDIGRLPDFSGFRYWCNEIVSHSGWTWNDFWSKFLAKAKKDCGGTYPTQSCYNKIICEDRVNLCKQYACEIVEKEPYCKFKPPK